MEDEVSSNCSTFSSFSSSSFSSSSSSSSICPASNFSSTNEASEPESSSEYETEWSRERDEYGETEESEETEESSRESEAEGSDRNDVCYICQMALEEEPQVHRCNCRFGFSHQSCLRRWAETNPRCRVCSIAYNVTKKSDNECFWCLEEVADEREGREGRQKLCRCEYQKIHVECLQERFNEPHAVNYQICPRCDTPFSVQVRDETVWLCTFRRLYVLLYVLHVVILSAAVTITIFGVNLFDWFLERPMKLIPIFDRYRSFLLFPGADVSEIVDILYLVTTIVILGFLVYCVCLYFYRHIYDYSTTKLLAFTLYAPLFFFAMHICGNVHLGIYCLIGILPRDVGACGARYDVYSLGNGPAGFVLVFLAFLWIFVTVFLAGWTVYSCVKGLIWMFCDREDRRVLVLPP